MAQVRRAKVDVKQAVAAAKAHIAAVYEDEHIDGFAVEETEFDPELDRWAVTLSFSKPWETPRTRAQEVLESLNPGFSGRRVFKTVVVTNDAVVLSMKDRMWPEAVG